MSVAAHKGKFKIRDRMSFAIKKIFLVFAKKRFLSPKSLIILSSSLAGQRLLAL